MWTPSWWPDTLFLINAASIICTQKHENIGTRLKISELSFKDLIFTCFKKQKKLKSLLRSYDLIVMNNLNLDSRLELVSYDLITLLGTISNNQHLNLTWLDLDLFQVTQKLIINWRLRDCFECLRFLLDIYSWSSPDLTEDGPGFVLGDLRTDLDLSQMSRRLHLDLQ